MTSVLLTRDDGVTFAIDESTLGLTSLEGVDAPAVELFTAKRAVGSGDVVTGQRLASRLISLTARARNCSYNRALRAAAVAFLQPSALYHARITYLGVTRVARDCRIKALAMPTGNIYEPFTLKLSLLCPRAFLEDEAAPSVALHTLAALTSTSVPQVPSCMGCRLSNPGHVPAPLRLTLTVEGDQPVLYPAVVSATGFTRVITSLAPTDRLVLDAEARMVWLNGSSALHMLDDGSALERLVLPCGGGLLGYHAAKNQELLRVRADYRISYLGM